MTWLPSLGIVSLVGAHLLAAVLGLYSSSPSVAVVQPLTGASINGLLEISVRADDGPMGSGVRSVEYQLGSTTGAWTPLSLDKESMTYKGSRELAAVEEGSHPLYIRATDFTGNLRTVSVTVTVSHHPSGPTEEREYALPADKHLSWEDAGTSDPIASKFHPRN
ncbi:hypothetical protein JQX13_47260 [Archangium violaceum]|uniref:Ig-like domain-containing protein n=1 Tax=Archangium violaceum TaxID=83451 RepID=UPI00193AE8CB|nr:Ig-like domain-containing protein [Archangium violaceum]QRK07524.1 hypothetical protein JQX13_47260 [Archangium violaceum]